MEFALAALVALSALYFFQGGGWNQNAHFATTVALVDDGTLLLDRYRDSTGDLSRADGQHVASAKPIGTALFAIPGYLVSKLLTSGVDNHGDRVILRAYITSLMTSGLALVLMVVLLYRLLRRRVDVSSAALVALATVLATPLWPNSTMLNSHALVSLTALAAFTLLDKSRLTGRPSKKLLVVAGMTAALPATLEYMTGVVLVPLGLYALWQCRPRWRVLLFGAGAMVVLAVPLIHHTILYGDPFHVGYASLVVQRFAADAGKGVMGFDGFSLARLYELTFGQSRGFFFLSPFLVSAVPGVVMLTLRRSTRPEGVVTGSIAWMILLMVASLVYWHSGSATGSRYALLFVAFSALPVAVVLAQRLWVKIAVGAGAALGFAMMLVGTSVTAIPPTPPPLPPYRNVFLWWWERFSVGNLASWKEKILVEEGIGTGQPTLPFAFNLGQLGGLEGLVSLVPYGIGMVVLGGALVWALRSARVGLATANGIDTSDSTTTRGVMGNVKCKRKTNVSAFRKIAMGTWQTAYDPSIYGTLRIRADKLLEYIEAFREKKGKKLTVTHAVAKALALAMRACPDANAILRRNQIWLREDVDVSLLVLMEDKGQVDLSATKICKLDEKSLEDVVTEIQQQVAKIRARKDKDLEQTRQSMKLIPWLFINTFLKLISFFAYALNLNLKFLGIPKDPFGGAMVTSIGSIGLEVGYVPIVPYSRVPIYVAPGEIKQEAVVDDGKVVVGSILNLNATFDHRVVDGGHASVLAKTLHKVLEDPFGNFDPL